MRKINLLFLISLFLCFFSCASSKPVARISVEKQKDLSGNWNDNDIRIVCDSIIDECINSNYIKKFSKKNNRLPYVKLGTILNLSDEYMDTTIIANKFRNSIINSGEMKFVASNSEVESLRDEQLSQADHVSFGTEAQFGNEQAADFMVQGTIKTVIDQNKDVTQKTYYVDIQLYDIESTEVVWTTENSKIVKVLNKKKLKF